MVNTQATYYAFPQALDFGSIAYGDSSQKQTVRIEYQLAQSSAGGNISGQPNVLNDLFYIDDLGSNAKDVITLSADGGTTFFNQLSLSSFPATSPPNFIKIVVNVAPVQNRTSTTGDFVVYLTSTQVPNFKIPIHFRIVNGLYVSATEIRKSLGPIGFQKSTVFTLHDSFTDANLPLWSSKIGTWSVLPNGTMKGTDNGTVDAIHVTQFPDFGDYSATSFVSLTSAGAAGIVFGFVNSNNYFRATISSITGNAQIDQVISGYATALTTVSVGTAVDSQYTLRVEKHPGSAQFHINDVLTLQWQGPISLGPSGLTVTSAGGNATTVNFNEYHASQDIYQFSDDDINTITLEEQSFIEQRTGRVYGTQTVTELLDYNEQDVLRMPFLLYRAFNTLGLSTSPDSALTSPQLTPNYEHAIWLRHRPILSVIAVEEDVSPDGSSPQWELKTQGRNGDYVAYPEYGKITFLFNLPRNGRQNLRVIYVVGTAGIPPQISGYIKTKVALRLLENIGVGNDAIKEMYEKKEKQLVRYEEFIPQKTFMYAVGSGQRKA